VQALRPTQPMPTTAPITDRFKDSLIVAQRGAAQW
jgi:hypothetical protein